ncbi:hypothetical protein CEXT_7741 [Caerostris extrusa]|uniref:Uncharacterized protein n=1 Tax=Caerostris extrusa TaxID=172846 RepID=A0AAV4Y2D5_CAEEX|nr:hypothetical protein CEXT_7741 [Caerostris extrusa]
MTVINVKIMRFQLQESDTFHLGKWRGKEFEESNLPSPHPKQMIGDFLPRLIPPENEKKKLFCCLHILVGNSYLMTI